MQQQHLLKVQFVNKQIKHAVMFNVLDVLICSEANIAYTESYFMCFCKSRVLKIATAMDFYLVLFSRAAVPELGMLQGAGARFRN